MEREHTMRSCDYDRADTYRSVNGNGTSADALAAHVSLMAIADFAAGTKDICGTELGPHAHQQAQH